MSVKGSVRPRTRCRCLKNERSRFPFGLFGFPIRISLISRCTTSVRKKSGHCTRGTTASNRRGQIGVVTISAPSCAFLGLPRVRISKVPIFRFAFDFSRVLLENVLSDKTSHLPYSCACALGECSTWRDGKKFCVSSFNLCCSDNPFNCRSATAEPSETAWLYPFDRVAYDDGETSSFT